VALESHHYRTIPGSKLQLRHINQSKAPTIVTFHGEDCRIAELGRSATLTTEEQRLETDKEIGRQERRIA
jgi:hypothetical protein